MNPSQKLTLIQQNDTHAQFEAHPELFWRDGKPTYRTLGGYARAATLVRQIRDETEGACLFVDCGDAIHGTAIAQWTRGAAVVAVLNAMGVDLMVPGNWEWGFGPQVLRERVAEMNFPVLCCNALRAETGEREFEPCQVREIGGVRVGILGVTSPIVTQTMPRPMGLGLRFEEPVDALPKALFKLRHEQGAELIVVVSHVGFPQDVKLAKEVEGIDVLLSAHTHNRLEEPVQIGKTLLIQSGFGGSFLGRLDLEVRGGKIDGWTHRLLPVEDSIEPDAGVLQVVNEQLAPHRDKLNEVVGQTATPLNRMTVLEATMDNLLTDAYLGATGAEVAFSHGWRYGSPILPGQVTLGDLWQIVPTNPEIVTFELSGAQIKQRIEANLENVYAPDAFDQKGGFVMRVSGLNAVVCLNNSKGTRVEHLDIAGAPLDPKRRYRVAAAGEQATQGAANVQNTGICAVDALRHYFEKHSPVEAELTHAKFVAV